MKLLVIIYETDNNNENLKKLLDSLKFSKFNFVLLGQNDKWDSFGTKILNIKKYLETIDPNTLILQLDARDVIVNNTNPDNLIKKFNENFDINKVLYSTEQGCCVEPLYNTGPKGIISSGVRNYKYINHNLSDKERENNNKTWTESMKNKNTTDKNFHYLNAGLVLGLSKNLLKIYNIINIRSNEDDQAILTDLFLQNPELFQLDYNQIIFSNSNAWDQENGCFYIWSESKWKNKITDTNPSFIQTPGKHWSCYNTLYDSLKK